MKTTFALSALFLLIANNSTAAESKKCAAKADGFLYANAAIEPNLRAANLKATYTEGTTIVGEGEKAVLEKYSYTPNEISDFTVSLIQETCRLKSIEFNVGE